jgi:hypothetical protein
MFAFLINKSVFYDRQNRRPPNDPSIGTSVNQGSIQIHKRVRTRFGFFIPHEFVTHTKDH